MDKKDIIRMARNEYGIYAFTAESLAEFATIIAAAERNKLADWMIERGYATGHGDTVEDLLKELEWQIAEREREACAKVVEDYCGAWSDEGYALAAAIRARGNT